MSSVSASIKTHSAASASSRSSGVRREAELAKLRLLQQRQQSELERQLQDAERLRQDAERQRQDAERQQQNIERQLKEVALAQEVERLELEAELLEQEEGEVSEGGRVYDGNGDSGAQPAVADRQRPSSGPAPQPLRATQVAADRISCWVNNHGSRPPSPERTASRNWIDRLDLPAATEVDQTGPTWAATAPSPLPKLTLEKFRGDPLHWPRWSALFKSLVHDRRELSDAERLTHLQTCLEGPAQDAVSGLMCDGSLYGEALRELQQQFGDPTAVVRSSLDRVLRLPPVKEHSPTQLSELSRALHACVSVLRSFGHHADLAATTNVAGVVAKLPMAMAWKWGEVVVARRPAQSTLEDIDSWLRSQALAARAVQVLGGEDDLRSGGDVTIRSSSGRRDGNQRAAASGGEVVTCSTGVCTLTSAPSVRCSCCGGSHGLGSCKELADMSVADRLQVVVQSRACYICLTAGHIARYCQRKRKCSVDGCGRFHHRILHGAAMSGPSLPATVCKAPASVGLRVGMVSATDVDVESVSGAGAAPAAKRGQVCRRLPALDRRLQRDAQLSEVTGQQERPSSRLVGVTARMGALADARRALEQKLVALDAVIRLAEQTLAERQQELEQLRSRAETATQQLRDERSGLKADLDGASYMAQKEHAWLWCVP